MAHDDVIQTVRDNIDEHTTGDISIAFVTRGSFNWTNLAAPASSSSTVVPAIRRQSRPRFDKSNVAYDQQTFSVAAADLPGVPAEGTLITDPATGLPENQKTYVVKNVERKCGGAMLDLVCAQNREATQSGQ